MFHNPMTYIPPAATKSDWLPFLQNFLNKLLLKDSIQDFQPLQDFLKMENYDSFLKKWDNAEPKRKSGYINAFLDSFSSKGMDDQVINLMYSSLLGYQDLKSGVEVPPPGQFDQFVEMLDKLLKTNGECLNDLRHMSDQLCEHLTGVRDCVFGIEEKLGKMAAARQEFSGAIFGKGEEEKEDPVAALAKGFSGWGTGMTKWASYVEIHMKNFFHYNKHELKALRELDLMRQYSLDNFVASKKTLSDEKATLFETKNLENWQCGKEDF
jgi:hypothetical protein